MHHRSHCSLMVSRVALIGLYLGSLMLGLPGCASQRSSDAAATLRSSQAAAEEFRAFLEPEGERPVLKVARAVQRRYVEALFGADSPDGDGEAALKKWKIPDELGETGDTPAPVLMEFLPAFRSYMKQYVRLISVETKAKLKDYPWVEPCADAFFDAMESVPSGEQNWRNVVSQCGDDARHPNWFFPLIIVIRTMEGIKKKTIYSRGDELMPSLMGEMNRKLAPLYVKYEVTPPTSVDPQEVADSISKLFRVAKEKYARSLETHNKEIRPKSPTIPSQVRDADGEEKFMVTKMPASLIEPLRAEIRLLVRGIEKLSTVKICRAIEGASMDQEALNELIRERFVDAVEPGMSAGLKILFRGKNVPFARYGKVNVTFNADANTVNRRGSARSEITVGKEVVVLCGRSKRAAYGFRPLVRKVDNYLSSGVSRGEFSTFNLSEDPLPTALVNQARAIEASHQQFLEALDFLLAHELAHLLLDDPYFSDAVFQKDREFRADMLAAAVVESVNPRTALNRFRAMMNSMQPGSDGKASGEEMAELATEDTMAGAEALFILIAETGYERQSQAGNSHPSLEARIARLREALYDLNYWSEKWTYQASH